MVLVVGGGGGGVGGEYDMCWKCGNDIDDTVNILCSSCRYGYYAVLGRQGPSGQSDGSTLTSARRRKEMAASQSGEKMVS